jgi:hypothetical protein
MIALPRQLAPWATQLALFPEDIALALGPLVLQIAALIGDARIDRGHAGMPDGYDGISRRGPYERLLVGEWALLEELPDEFLRRAVSGEHLFLQRAFRQNASARKSLALFDAGIDQLGAPRVLHLAALIVLAQRAERSRAALEWGILQDPAATMHDCVTAVTVRELLAGRSLRGAGSGDIERFIGSTDRRTVSEIWLVGSEPLVAAAPRYQACALAVSDVLERGAVQRVTVVASGPGLPRPREITLAIPEGPRAVQLLRDPFATAAAAWQGTSIRIDVKSNIVFSPDGRRLHVRGAGGSLVTVQIPNSPRAKVALPAAFTPPPGESVVAVGQSAGKRRTMVLCRRGNEFALRVLSKRAATAVRIDRYAIDGRVGSILIDRGAFPDDMPLRLLVVLKDVFLCFVAGDERLTTIVKGQLAAEQRPRTMAARIAGNTLIHIERAGGGARAMATNVGASGDIHSSRIAVDLPPLSGDTRVYFGPVGLANVIAYSPRQSRCTIVHRLHSTTFDVPQTHEVVGMIERGHPEPKPFAVAIDASRTAIELLRPGQSERLLTTSSAITFAAASDAAPVIAFITQTGELGIYSCKADAMVLRIAPEPVL